MSADVRQLYVKLFVTSSQPVFTRMPHLRADVDYGIICCPHSLSFIHSLHTNFTSSFMVSVAKLLKSNYRKHHLQKQNRNVYLHVTIVTNYAEVVSCKTDSGPVRQEA